MQDPGRERQVGGGVQAAASSVGVVVCPKVSAGPVNSPTCSRWTTSPRWASCRACRPRVAGSLTARRKLERGPKQTSATKAVAEAEQRLRRLHVAIEAGVDPAALVEPINRAQEELEAARVEQQHVPAAWAMGEPSCKRRSTTSGTSEWR